MAVREGFRTALQQHSYRETCYMENLRLLLLPLCVLILLPWKTEKTELTFMDVGQGDGIYMDCGEHILIDSGSSSSRHIGEYTAEPFLQSKAVGRLEHVFVTHADGDHKNGIEYLLNNDRFSIETLYLPWQAQRDEKYDSLSESSAGKIKYLKAGDVLEIGRGRIYCLSPESSEEISDTNEQSLVLLHPRRERRAAYLLLALEDELHIVSQIGMMALFICLTMIKVDRELLDNIVLKDKF